MQPMRGPDTIDRERGATAILVAGVLVFLMAFAWLAIDAGLGFDDRRGTQNAADLAALAGAWEACNPSPGGDPAAAARAAAAQNGYPDGGATVVDVDVQSGTAHQVTVTISETNQSIFGGAGNAPESMEIVSRAAAECEEVGFLGDHAVFGGHDGSCGSNVSPPAIVELDARDSISVTGNIHSNERLFAGISPSHTGRATHRSGVAGMTADQFYGAPLDYPTEVSAADFHPASGSRVAGLGDRYFDLGSGSGPDEIGGWVDPDDPDVTNDYSDGTLTIDVPGVYYAGSDGIDLSSANVTVGTNEGVSFISAGVIDLGTLTGAVPGYGGAPVAEGGTVPILALSDAGQLCGDPGSVVLRSDGAVLSGVIVAATGDIQIHPGGPGAGFTLAGSLIGYEISFVTHSGELGALTIDYQEDPTVDPNYRVELID